MHEITPLADSARRVRDGEPASLARASDYPAVARCASCGEPIRCERWFRGSWRHAG